MSNNRRWLYKKEAKKLGLKVKENQKGRENARYTISDEDWLVIYSNRMKPNKRNFVEVIHKKDKDGDIISTTEKLQSKPIDVPDNFEVVKISTSKTTGQQWVQYKPKEVEEQVNSFDFDAILKKYTENIKPIKVKKVEQQTTQDFQVLTYTDVHIGMDTNKDNNSMYSFQWDRENLLLSAERIISKVKENITSKILVIDDLGDLLDGLNAKTTRGGHDLPQNMTNEEAFDCALEFKMYLLDGLIAYFGKIIVNNICNDNHAGCFGYFANEAFKQIAQQKYPEVKIVNHRKFINHYFIGDVCFIITHGKDDKTLKFGFNPKLDPKQIEKIDQYCKHYDIYKQSKLIVFKKGDSHQALFDMCNSDDFYYFNYPALSPSSQWVQNNFKKGRRGFVLESYLNRELTLKPIYL